VSSKCIISCNFFECCSAFGELPPHLAITHSIQHAIVSDGETTAHFRSAVQGTLFSSTIMSTIISTVEAPARRSIEQTCDDLAALLLAVISVISILTFRDYGLGWDDYTHAEYAELLLQLYRSGFNDAHALSFANLYMYGGGFDMAAALLHKIMPFDLFETRRLLGAIVGDPCIATASRVARRVTGPAR